MMRRSVDTTLTARVCQIASLLLILMMVLGVLVQEVMHNAESAGADPGGVAGPTRFVVAP